jgi:hypothetical protein
MGGLIDHPSSGLGIVRPPSDRPDCTFARSAVNVTHLQLAFAVEAEIGSNSLGDRATMTEAVPAAPETALFVTDDELHKLIAPHLGRDRFRAALKTCERGDPLFPRINPLWRGRYWPAVRAWLDRDQEVGSNGSIQDGPENFDAPTRQSTRAKARPSPAALLDRPASGPRPHGFPRQVHPAPSRR